MFTILSYFPYRFSWFTAKKGLSIGEIPAFTVVWATSTWQSCTTRPLRQYLCNIPRWEIYHASTTDWVGSQSKKGFIMGLMRPLTVVWARAFRHTLLIWPLTTIHVTRVIHTAVLYFPDELHKFKTETGFSISETRPFTIVWVRVLGQGCLMWPYMCNISCHIILLWPISQVHSQNRAQCDRYTSLHGCLG